MNSAPTTSRNSKRQNPMTKSPSVERRSSSASTAPANAFLRLVVGRFLLVLDGVPFSKGVDPLEPRRPDLHDRRQRVLAQKGVDDGAAVRPDRVARLLREVGRLMSIPEDDDVDGDLLLAALQVPRPTDADDSSRELVEGPGAADDLPPRHRGGD